MPEILSTVLTIAEVRNALENTTHELICETLALAANAHVTNADRHLANVAAAEEAGDFALAAKEREQALSQFRSAFSLYAVSATGEPRGLGAFLWQLVFRPNHTAAYQGMVRCLKAMLCLYLLTGRDKLVTTELADAIADTLLGYAGQFSSERGPGGTLVFIDRSFYKFIFEAEWFLTIFKSNAVTLAPGVRKKIDIIAEYCETWQPAPSSPSDDGSQGGVLDDTERFMP